MKRSFSLVPKWCAWPVFLGLVAIAVGIFPGSHGAAEEGEANPLDSYATNLNEEAKAGNIDPLIGRMP